MLKDSHCFVAGGRTGFIGANITKALLKAGANVMATSKNPDKESLFPIDTKNLVQGVGDLSQLLSIYDKFIGKRMDYVFHCAAHTSGAKEMIENPVAQITENLFMNSNLLDIAAKSGVKKFVFISSSAIYPESDTALTENMGFNDDPPDNYFGPAWMKRYAEKLAEFYHRQYGMEVLIIRPSNVYGPMCSFDLEHSHVLPALIRKFVEKHNPLEVWGNKSVVRDFIFVDDFVDGVMKAFEHFKGFDVFNIASAKLYTIGEAVGIIKDLTHYDGEIKYNASKPTTIQERKIDAHKALFRLNWVARTSFRDGLQKTIDWYMGHKS